jgi:hypothetical protein
MLAHGILMAVQSGGNGNYLIIVSIQAGLNPATATIKAPYKAGLTHLLNTSECRGVHLPLTPGLTFYGEECHV